MDNLFTTFVKARSGKGLSLVELIIALAISSIIFIVVVAIINIVLSRSKGGFESFKAQSEALGIMNRMAKEIRQATEVVSAQAQTITFREYIEASDAAPSQVRFYLVGQTLSRGEIPPTGSGPNYTYDPASESTRTLSFDIINGGGAIFTYFDQNGSTLGAPVTLSAVTLIGINLTFRQISNTQPLSVRTKAQLRFNKNNL